MCLLVLNLLYPNILNGRDLLCCIDNHTRWFRRRLQLQKLKKIRDCTYGQPLACSASLLVCFGRLPHSDGLCSMRFRSTRKKAPSLAMHVLLREAYGCHVGEFTQGLLF